MSTQGDPITQLCLPLCPRYLRDLGASLSPSVDSVAISKARLGFARSLNRSPETIVLTAVLGA
jgi:hypothetical protein